MENMLLIDGLDIEDLGLSITAIPGEFDSPDGAYDVVDIPELDGVFLASERPRIGARSGRVEGVIVQETMAECEESLQTLKDSLAERMFELIQVHAPTRAYYGVLAGPVRGQLAHPGDDDGIAAVAFDYLCPDPYAVDLDQTEVTGVAGERVAVPQGTGPTFPFVRINGPTVGTTITLALRDKTRNPIGAMVIVLLGALTVDDAILISTIDGGDIWLWDAGVVSDATPLLSANYSFPVILPRYADRVGGALATIETDDGTIAIVSPRRWR